MSSTPPQQQAVCTCDECGATKKTATHEVTFSSTTNESKTRHHKGSVDWDGFAGGTDRENTETRSNGSTVKRKENFFICPTEGCVRRKIDRWKAREWELRNDPDLNNSQEYREQEKQRIHEEEESIHRDAEEFLSQNRTTKRGTRRGEEMDYHQQNNEGYNRVRTENETESSRQSASDSARQSDNRSRDNNTQSRQSDQQTTVNGWGIADADRSSSRSGENRDAFRNDVDTRASQTTNGNEAFADNVYDDEEQTAAERDAFQDSLDPEELDEEETESYNYSHSRSRKHP